MFHSLRLLLSHVPSQILKPRLVNILWWGEGRVKVLYVNVRNLCKFLLLIFLHQLITFAVIFYSLTFSISHNLEFIWSNIFLIVLSISFLTELVSLVVGWFKMFTLWFKVIKPLPVPFTSTLSGIFASSAYLTPS